MTALYLIQYGRPGFVGWFRAAPEIRPSRGDRVVVQGPRGLELGTVLCRPAERFVDSAPLDGECLRPVSDTDDAAETDAASWCRAVLAEAETAAAEAALPLTFVDAEATLDRSGIVLHAIPWADCDANELLADLTTRCGAPVRLLDLSRVSTAVDLPSPTTPGCGKPGCGSGGGGCSSCDSGGCSTGGCSSGQVKSAEELTTYFVGLRRKMEAANAVRAPLM